MKRLLPVLLLLAVPAVAQSVVTPARFTLSGKVQGMSIKGTALVAADAVDVFQVSQRVALRNDNVMISLPATSTSDAASAGALGTKFLAGPQFTLPKLPFLKGTVLGSPTISMDAFAEMGVSRSSANQTLDERVGFDLNYTPSSTNPTTVNLIEIGYDHGSTPIGVGTNGLPEYGNNAVFYSIGISF